MTPGLTKSHTGKSAGKKRLEIFCKMITDTRKKTCIACGAKLLEDLVHIGDQYPSAIYSKLSADYRLSMQPLSLNLTKCSNNSCGLVQLAHEYSLDSILEKYPYLSGGTATMTRILSDVVKEVEGLASFGTNDAVLDIGGNDGTLLNLLSKDVKWKINIDAAHGITSVLDDPNYLRIQEKFSSNAYLNLDIPLPKIIFSVAMFYQLNDPTRFCREVKKIMSDDTIWCVQMTYLGSMLASDIYDNIVHEHVAYYSLKSLEYVMNESGLKICGAKIVDSYGGSLRVYVMKKKGKFSRQDLAKDCQSVKSYESKKGINTVEALEEFNERITLLKKLTRELIFHIIDRGGKIWAFGASTKGNMICQFIGVNHNHIEHVLDNNKKKIGLMMIGSDIPIVNEKEYLPNLPEFLFILPYYYIDHFKPFIRKHLKVGQNISLIVPLPKPHLIKLSGT